MAIRIGRRVIEKDDESDRAKRVDLKALELPMQPTTSQPFAPNLDLTQRRERLDFHFTEFRRLASLARKEAEIYLNQHSLMLDELEAEKVKLAEQQAQLDKLEAGLPKFGGKDEKDPGPDAS